jgi:hypothetical protein
MANILFIFFAAICLAAPPVRLALALEPAAPLVYLPLTERNFGDVFAGEELEQVFPVRNDGDAPLEMDRQLVGSQPSPAPRDGWLRASALQAGGPHALAPVPAALRRAAPS